MPKLNLKAVVRIKDVPLKLSFENEQTSSSQENVTAPRGVTPENIVVDSQPADVKSSFSDDEFSSSPRHSDHHEEYDFNEDEEIGEFKSMPTTLLDNKYQDEFSELEDDDVDYSEHNLDLGLPLKDEPHLEDSIDKTILADLVHPDNLSDADSSSGHSNISSDPYKIAALQITHQQQQRSQAALFTSLKEPLAASSSNETIIVTTRNEQPKPSANRRKRKIADDPATMPLCERLFFNPPLNIFQAKEREDITKSLEAEESNTMKAPPLPITKKRRSSRTVSQSSSTSRRQSLDSSVDLDESICKSGDENIEKEAASNAVNDVPLLVLDESGNIVMNKPSQVTVEEGKKPEVKSQSSTTYNSFRRRQCARNTWNAEDTSVFYCALEKVGTDFSLMEAIYFKNRGRDRKQLKQKFKREEKVNREFIDKILFKSLINQSYQARSQLVQEHVVGSETQADNDENEFTNIAE